MNNEEIILRSDDKAASMQTVTGWVSRNGRFYGKDERTARYDGCTHSKCKCGNIANKYYSKCDECRNKASKERYSKLTFKEWDGKTPVCNYGTDEYFFDADDIEYYLEDNSLEPRDLELMYCDPNHFTEINGEQWEEILPENSDGELPNALEEKLKELNKFINNLPPASWSEGRFRTEYIRF